MQDLKLISLLPAVCSGAVKGFVPQPLFHSLLKFDRLQELPQSVFTCLWLIGRPKTLSVERDYICVWTVGGYNLP